MNKMIISAIKAGLVVLAVAAPEQGSERYGFRTFRERVAGVTVLADTTLAAPDPREAYVPIVVAVGLDPATPAATVTRESFTLVDAGGNRLAAAGAIEIRKRYGRVAFDASIIRAQRMTIGQQFAGYVEIPSRFYGDTKGLGLVQDRVHLDPSTWFRDVVYFPRPPAGLGGILTLRLEGGGLESRIDVRFRVIEAE